jgi:hypothetical protein
VEHILRQFIQFTICQSFARLSAFERRDPQSLVGVQREVPALKAGVNEAHAKRKSASTRSSTWIVFVALLRVRLRIVSHQGSILSKRTTEESDSI